MKLEKNIRILEKITETSNSELFKAAFEEDRNTYESLYYAVKVPKNGPQTGLSARKEMEISHQIENSSSYSITIPVLTYVEAEDGSYTIMQFKRSGQFLSDLIETIKKKDGEVPVQLGVILTLKILRALEQLHHCFGTNGGYLHLDLHPGNIFVENIDLERFEFGSAKFIDFQNSIRLNSDGRIDDDQQLKGVTDGFSAPELIYQERNKISQATDLYSAGAILYWMLTDECYDSITGMQLDSLSCSEIVRYRMRLFLECLLDETASYRYSSAAAALKALEAIGQCISQQKQFDYYLLLQSSYYGNVPLHSIGKISYDSKGFEVAVHTLYQKMHADRVNYQECFYIYKGLTAIRQDFSGTVRQSLTARLLSCGLSAATHLADAESSRAIYGEIIQYKPDIPLMEYLNLQNQMAEIFFDEYSFEKSLTMISDNLAALTKIKETTESVAGLCDMGSSASYLAEYARALSSYGCKLYLARGEDPMPYFQKALSEFDLCTDEGEREGNKTITICHILHYAIDKGNRNLFEEYIDRIVPGKTWQERFEYFLDDKHFNPFHLWPVMKAIVMRGRDEIDEKLYHSVYEAFRGGTFDKILKEHVKRLVMRYVGLIGYLYTNNVNELLFVHAFDRSINLSGNGEIRTDRPLNIIRCMNYHTLWIYYQLISSDDAKMKVRSELLELAVSSKWGELEDWINEHDSLNEMLRFEFV